MSERKRLAVPQRRPAVRDPRPPMDGTSRRDWERLSNEIRACQLCPLGGSRIQAVVYRGSLSPRVAFIGEAPGAEEDRTGVPFSGRSGRELDRAIARLGLSPEEFGILNTLKCRPPRNRYDRSAARACRPYLDRQLGLLRPEILVTLGATALHAIDPDAPAMLKSAGHPRSSSHGVFFPLVHPAAALRSTRMRARWERDVLALKHWLAVRVS